MKNCPKCNAQVNDDTNFCPACGAKVLQPVAAAGAQQSAPFQENSSNASQAQPNVRQQPPQPPQQQPQANGGYTQTPNPGQPYTQANQGPAAPGTPPPYYNNTNPQQPGTDKFKDGVNTAVDKTKNFFFNTTDESTLYDQEDIQSNKILALVSYLQYFFFIPMIIKPQSRYLRFHGNQGLSLLLSSIALTIVHGILCAVFGLFAFAGAPGAIISALLIGIFSIVIYGAILVWIILGIYNAVTGKAKELPLIGRFRILKEF